MYLLSHTHTHTHKYKFFLPSLSSTLSPSLFPESVLSIFAKGLSLSFNLFVFRVFSQITHRFACAVGCNVLQCVAVFSLFLVRVFSHITHGFACAVHCSVIHCVAVCCSVLQCVAVCGSVWQCVSVCGSELQYIFAFFTQSFLPGSFTSLPLKGVSLSKESLSRSLSRANDFQVTGGFSFFLFKVEATKEALPAVHANWKCRGSLRAVGAREGATKTGGVEGRGGVAGVGVVAGKGEVARGVLSSSWS